MEWLEQNKDWFLSGAGIFIVSSIVSFASVLLTLWWKSRSEKKKLKRLKVSSGVSRLTISSPNESDAISDDHVKVSYKGNEFENLCVYTVQVNNIGIPAIEKQRLHILIPTEARIIEVVENKSLQSIKLDKKEMNDSEKKEIIYEFERLERNDMCSISYLLDMKDSLSISSEPRGVDEIEYSYKEDIDSYEINRLVLYVATFVFADMIPLIGGLLQALVVIAASPVIIEMFRKYAENKRSNDSVLHIHGGIQVDEKGTLQINQS